jgi:hypothetical protein
MISDLAAKSHPLHNYNPLILVDKFFLKWLRDPCQRSLTGLWLANQSLFFFDGWAEEISHFLCCYIIKPPSWTLSKPEGGFFLHNHL